MPPPSACSAHASSSDIIGRPDSCYPFSLVADAPALRPGALGAEQLSGHSRRKLCTRIALPTVPSAL